MPPQPQKVVNKPLAGLIVLIGGSGLLAWVSQSHSLLSLLACGLGAWGALQALPLSRVYPREVRTFLHAIILLPGWTLWLIFHSAPFLEEEQWSGISYNIADRMRLEEIPAIFPHTFYDGIPQTFYVQSNAAQTSVLRIQNHSVEGVSLGQGLFRHTLVASHSQPVSRTLTATLILDGTQHHRTLKRVIPLAHPRWFCSDPQRGIAVTLSEETDEGVLISSTGSHFRFSTGESPSDCLILPESNQILISHRHSPFLWLIDLKTRELKRKVRVGLGQHRLALSPSRDKIALIRNTDTWKIDLLASSKLTRLTTISSPAPADWIVFGQSSSVILFSSKQNQRLYRFEEQEKNWEHTSILLGRPATVMTSDSLGKTVYLATTGFSQNINALNENHFIEDQILGIDTTNLTVKHHLKLPVASRDKLKAALHEPAIYAGSPLGIAVYDKQVLITLPGTNEVWSLSDSLGPPFKRLAFDQDHLRQPVGVTWLGSSTWAITSPSEGTIEIHYPGGPTRVALTKPTASLLDIQIKQRLGEQVFYESTRSGRSCQSCHLHGDSDYSTHNIGDVKILPSTLSILGLAGTSPYLRQGSYKQIHHLMDLLNYTFGGFDIEDPQRGEHLEAFVESRPLPINPNHLGALSAHHQNQIQDGYKVFLKAQCNLCHPPPAFTHLGKLPVTSLFPEFSNPTYFMDTPSLLGIWRSAPYLYDGRSADLKSLLTKHNGANRHGDTQSLTDSEIDTLAYFLETL